MPETLHCGTGLVNKTASSPEELSIQKIRPPNKNKEKVDDQRKTKKKFL